MSKTLYKDLHKVGGNPENAVFWKLSEESFAKKEE